MTEVAQRASSRAAKGSLEAGAQIPVLRAGQSFMQTGGVMP